MAKMNQSANVPASDNPMRARSETRPPRPNRRNYALFFISWFMLIAIGVMSTMLYADYLKEQIAADISAQTGAQLAAIQADYQRQLDELKGSTTSELAALQKKVDTFNELLTFTRDSANSRTDNSNQLYTQLAEVKQQLDELKKNLDVLK